MHVLRCSVTIKQNYEATYYFIEAQLTAYYWKIAKQYEVHNLQCANILSVNRLHSLTMIRIIPYFRFGSVLFANIPCSTQNSVPMDKNI